MLTELAKHLRRLLSEPSNDADLAEFLDFLDVKILDISSSDDAGQQQRDFEEELQVIFNEDVDYSRSQQAEIFLQTLLHARPILSFTSFIATWFDLLLRPALRDPRLSSSAVEHAKQFVIESLEGGGDKLEIVTNFRRRLLDLFLLDVFNESSGEDILEWAQLGEDQKEKHLWWKSNLEDILVGYGLLQPEELMDVMNDCFTTPSSRLQILILLDSLVAHPSFIDISAKLFTHPFLSSIFRSLEVDNSSTVCAVELALLIKILPAAAIKAYEPLKDALPRLFGILGRVLCWKSYTGRNMQDSKVPYSELLDYDDTGLLEKIEKKELEDDIEDFKANWQAKLRIKEDLDWKRLERTFDMSTSSLPVPRQFFTFLYFLFPCNTVKFLRQPSAFLQESYVDSPWTVGWEDALDDLQIRTAGSLLLRTHVLHPSILSQDAISELAASDHWSSYDISRIVGECMMLDSYMASQANRCGGDSYGAPLSERQGLGLSGDITMTQTPTVRAAQLDTPPLHQRRISLHDLIATSAALKSGADINVSDKSPVWPSILFTPPPSTAPSRSSSVDPSMDTAPASPTDEIRMPTQVKETIAGLQREVLLLRTELNFELWLKRENVQHIGRLHQDGVKTKNAELQQQRLQNRLRDYRKELVRLKEKEKSQQDEAVLRKQTYDEWNEDLSSKNRELREQKNSEIAKANILRSTNVDLEAHLAAQGKLLDDAQNRVFQLETQIKQDAPKVQRLRDYEKRIEQLTAMHRMWNKDISLYNEQSKEMSELISEHQKMKQRVEAYEKAQEDAEEAARASQRRIQALEANLCAAERSADPYRPNVNVMQMLTLQAAEQNALAKSNSALLRENEGLREEMDELRATLEVLQAQSSGIRGLVRPEGLISLLS
ncbi:Hamartin protein-domain-containing protein [Phellopilus nigrolimitatus]|nr:Hamartin protein-domain-containing protein [Phellopilus nigrolimitatus]